MATWADKIGEFATEVATGTSREKAPPKEEAEFSRTTGEEAEASKKAITEAGEESSALAKTLAEEVKGSRADPTKAAGDELVNAAKDITSRTSTPEMSDVQVQRTTPIERTTVDKSGIPQVNTTINAPDMVGPAGRFTPGAGTNILTNLAQALQQRALGQGPSVAGDTAQRNREAALAASLAQQASLRGGFDPAAARQIRQSAADIQAQTARDEMTARMEEQRQAELALGDTAKAIEDVAAEAGRQAVTEKGVDVTQRGQGLEADIATTRAELENKGYAQDLAKFEADLNSTEKLAEAEIRLKENLAQVDVDAMLASTEYKAETEVAMFNAANELKAELTSYQGDVNAIAADMQDANEILMRGLQAGMNANDLMAAYELKLQSEGKSEREAQIIAKNAYKKTLAAVDKRNADRDAKTKQVLVEQTVNLLKPPMGGTSGTAGAGGESSGDTAGDVAGDIASILPLLTMLSDARAKHNIQEVSQEDIDELLEAFTPKTFEYIDPSNGVGEKIGFMIQDIEHTKLGKMIVVEKDGYKRYDAQNLIGVLMTALKAERNK